MTLYQMADQLIYKLIMSYCPDCEVWSIPIPCVEEISPGFICPDLVCRKCGEDILEIN